MPPPAFPLEYCFSNMSFHDSSGNWPRTWAQQTPDHRGAGHAQGSDGYNSQNPRADDQFGSEEPLYQHRYARGGISQYSYNVQDLPRASYSQGTAISTGNYTSQAATIEFPGGYRSVPYANTVPQYSQQYVAVVFNSCWWLVADKSRSQPWPQGPPNLVATGSQAMVHSHLYTAPAGYVGSALPPVAPM